MCRSTHLLQLSLALFLILNYPPPLCQNGFTRVEICPRHNHGFYLTDLVQFHVERLHTMTITLPFDESSKTSFLMRLLSPGFRDDCVYVKTFRKGGFAQFSCEITFPGVALEFHRENSAFPARMCLETMGFYLRNVSANAEVNLIFQSGKNYALHIVKPNFYNLFNILAKKAAERNLISEWKSAVISNFQALSAWAYFRHNAPKCYV